MPRKPNLIPTQRLVTYIPEDVYDACVLDLWSDVKGGVPRGDWSKVVTELLRQALKAKSLPRQVTTTNGVDDALQP